MVIFPISGGTRETRGPCVPTPFRLTASRDVTALGHEETTVIQTSGLPVDTPPALEPDTKHAYHRYTIMVNEQRTGISRARFLEAMNAENVGVGVRYLGVLEHPFRQETLGWKP